MKRFIFFVFVLVVSTAHAQTTDEPLRRKLAADYLEVMLFEYETPQGEAVANLVIKSFKEELTVPAIDQSTVVSENDKVKLSALEFALKKLITDPAPSWSQLLEAEKNYLILKDKQLTRHSKYKQQ